MSDAPEGMSDLKNRPPGVDVEALKAKSWSTRTAIDWYEHRIEALERDYNRLWIAACTGNFDRMEHPKGAEQ